MNAALNSPTSVMPEPRQIALDLGELDAEQLEEVVWSGGLSSGGGDAPPPVG
ncbi:hypothetical protein [Bradyrhizobium sp. WSM1743]|uniref:hypothetical protein n=1 Tax=Bradyrhizobium sp. WSM1743 TaxID=318996 RepID=UPI0012EB86C3|nr:hypothetical protein [Bradyrhizobium sp. WSM1743]